MDKIGKNVTRFCYFLQPRPGEGPTSGRPSNHTTKAYFFYKVIIDKTGGDSVVPYLPLPELKKTQD